MQIIFVFRDNLMEFSMILSPTQSLLPLPKVKVANKPHKMIRSNGHILFSV